MAQPLVSVVVPSRGRPARLARLLASLAAQSLESAAFEVIVVLDGRDPASERVLAQPREFDLRPLIQDEPSGPAAARNRGWQRSRAELVAFTDDDCVAEPEWLTAFVACAGSQPGAIVQGITVPDPEDAGNAGPYSHTVAVSTLGPQYETCNILYPRAVLEAVGGFDETLGRGPTAEDTDLAWRAIATGVQTALCPAARVRHAVERLGPLGMLRLARRWEGAVAVLARHPGTREILYGGVFWNVWHYLMWRSLLSLAAPRWLRRLIVARHLGQLRARAAAVGAGPTAVAFLLLHDAVECWGIARGAWRNHTPVL